VTEAEAATKWCPMVRFHLTNNATDPPVTNLPNSGTTCIGGQCMVWRWTSGSFEQGGCGLMAAGP
jgi:hypothetical protein